MYMHEDVYWFLLDDEGLSLYTHFTCPKSCFVCSDRNVCCMIHWGHFFKIVSDKVKVKIKLSIHMPWICTEGSGGAACLFVMLCARCVWVECSFMPWLYQQQTPPPASTNWIGGWLGPEGGPDIFDKWETFW